MKRREPTVDIDGVVLLDKPDGLSSNAALQRTRRCLQAAKAGHTGTLDPMATGLLPVCLGDSTKFSQGLLDADKGYLATARLGVTTDTGDREGQVLEQRPVEVEREAIERVLSALTGRIEQVPPMYSALKHKGRPLYAIARAGGEVDRAPREVRIHRLELVEWTSPLLTFAVDCSKGTYVRTLAEEIGERLGTGAHLVGLRRTMVGPFRIEQAVTLGALEAEAPEGRIRHVLPVDTLVLALPQVVLDDQNARHLLQGREVVLATTRPCGESANRVRIYVGQGADDVAGPRFLGVGSLDRDGRLRAVRLIAHIADATGPKIGASREIAGESA